MFNIELMLAVAILVGFIVYKQIQKISEFVDENEKNPNMEKYDKFCDYIDDEIDKIGREFKLDIIKLKDENKKDEFLDKISVLRKELVFVQNMSSSNKNKNDWKKRLFDFLSKFEDVLNEYITNSEVKNDEIRENLKVKFSSYKG